MLLLIPGPVSTHASVRAAAAKDYAPWDNDFCDIYARIRRRVVTLAGGDPAHHACLPLPGAGHFALEAAIRSFVPQNGRILLPATGQYADRLARLATETGRTIIRLPVPADTKADPAALHQALAADPTITHAALVYSETSTGIVHDVPALAAAAARTGRRVIVDAVSAFGALPFDIATLPMVDAVIFTANKCMEGLPGMSFTVSPIDRLQACANQAQSWSFDLPALYQHALQHGWGSHRFTPAAGIIAAFDVALDLFDAEGGQPARLARYTANMQAARDGARAAGLPPCLPDAVQGPIVLNVEAPPRLAQDDPAWDLQHFVDGVKSRGFILSNFYNTPEPSIRIGCIGAITPHDMRAATAAMAETLAEMRIPTRRAA